jgi:hypothetical protein
MASITRVLTARALARCNPQAGGPLALLLQHGYDDRALARSQRKTELLIDLSA